MPELTPEQNQAFARVLTHADRLFEALEDLAAAGDMLGARSPIDAGNPPSENRSSGPRWRYRIVVRSDPGVDRSTAARTRDWLSAREGVG